MEIRIGQGIDIHQLAEGRPFILGGVEIPHPRGLLGHSDADALLHALTDAILGAAGKGDIGIFFPNTESQWKDARSTDLLQRAWQTVKAEGWRVINIDSSVVAEEPKISPHIPKMKQIISEILGINPDACGIKATTSEGMGYEGRREGVTCFAVALLGRG